MTFDSTIKDEGIARFIGIAKLFYNDATATSVTILGTRSSAFQCSSN